MQDYKNSATSLKLAHQVQMAAKALGFDWPEALPVFDKVLEELQEVKEAYLENDPAAISDELGDLLFAAVNLCRHLDVSPDQALDQATSKFSGRFTLVQRLASERDINMNEASIDELEVLWLEAKGLQPSKGK
jgi:ATP diphosphatase